MEMVMDWLQWLTHKVLFPKETELANGSEEIQFSFCILLHSLKQKWRMETKQNIEACKLGLASDDVLKMNSQSGLPVFGYVEIKDIYNCT